MTRFLQVLSRHPRWAAIIAGLLAATGFPPLGLWPIGFAGVALFAWLVWQSATWRQAALLAWLFGVAHFTLTDNWIATAFTFQAQMPPALGWAAVPLLSLYLAVFPAIGIGLAKAVVPKASLAAFAPALGAGWIVGEWLRSWVFTGYAWGPLSLMLVGPFRPPRSGDGAAADGNLRPIGGAGDGRGPYAGRVDRSAVGSCGGDGNRGDRCDDVARARRAARHATLHARSAEPRAGRDQRPRALRSAVPAHRRALARSPRRAAPPDPVA